MKFGVINHTKISEILGNHHTFSVAWKTQVLNLALKQVFDDEYMHPVKEIKNELVGLE